MVNPLDDPAIQAGVAPLVVALVVAAALSRARLAWLGIVAAYATMIALSTGFSFTPLTALRKVTLLGLAAPLAGIAADFLMKRSHVVAPALAATAGALSVWVFISVLQQRERLSGVATAFGIALFAAALVYAVLRLRGDGLRAGAAGLGLGLATGIVALLSASVGFLAAGVAVAAGAGALLLVQALSPRTVPAGFTGTLTIGVTTTLFALGTLLLAELKWYVLPALLLVPTAAMLPAPERAPRVVRAAVLAGYALAAAVIPILAAWYAARGSFH